MTASTFTDVRTWLVETLRRDLIGPGPQDGDLARERLKEKPSGWYVTGYLAPVPEPSGPSAEIPEEDGPALLSAPRSSPTSGSPSSNRLRTAGGASSGASSAARAFGRRHPSA
jgi:hypothetical protein